MKTTVDLSPLSRFQDALNKDLRFKSNGPIRQALRAWAGIYGSWLRTRYRRLSRSKGGGAWPALAKSTIKKKGHSLILIETGLMLKELSVDFERKPAKRKDIALGVKVLTFEGSPSYDNGKSVSDVAGYHQKGAGHLPKREIVVDPPPHILRKMAKRLEKAIKSLL